MVIAKGYLLFVRLKWTLESNRWKTLDSPQSEKSHISSSCVYMPNPRPACFYRAGR